MAVHNNWDGRERWQIIVSGIVQGVGFRPFVARLAHQLGLSGYVLNDTKGVIIEVEGPASVLQEFLRRLSADKPPLAFIRNLSITRLPVKEETGFHIYQSRVEGRRWALISPDVATCTECLKELRDPDDRRYRYPFLNCTNCGPRFTIIKSVPYDRVRTTMATFPMCSICKEEYEDPLNRRFHAEPTACPTCGPQVALLDRWGNRVDCTDPIAKAGELIKGGSLLAVKGLGGYHIACDAQNETAVQRLRNNKRRDFKPFAVMAKDLETTNAFCFLTPLEREELQSWRRPIVISRLRNGVRVAPSVAPNHDDLGVFLPYTPLHHLLLDFAPPLLVMTSGNISDEPIVYRDDEALQRLGPTVDFFLTHNRPIHMRCDDSVLRFVGSQRVFIRRSRGYAPEPIGVSFRFPVALLAVGAMLKNTFAVCRDDAVVVSHHIGDLDDFQTFRSFRESIEHYKNLFDTDPVVIAHDLHPEYPSTRFAEKYPARLRIGVQHHHAHIASVMAEYGLTDPVIGVAYDGTGYGPDGAIWGGEFLVATYEGYRRVGHLEEVPMPGGEKAVRHGWRMALSWLLVAYGPEERSVGPWIRDAVGRTDWDHLWDAVSSGFPFVNTTSIGRLFDAVSSLLNLRHESGYEGHAAVLLELTARRGFDDRKPYRFDLIRRGRLILSAQPVIRQIVQDICAGVDKELIAYRFHKGLAQATARMCRLVSQDTGFNKVVLSGGVMQNGLLLQLLLEELSQMDLQVYIPAVLPPNDGGICLGQAAVAAHIIRSMADVAATERVSGVLVAGG